MFKVNFYWKTIFFKDTPFKEVCVRVGDNQRGKLDTASFMSFIGTDSNIPRKSVHLLHIVRHFTTFCFADFRLHRKK